MLRFKQPLWALWLITGVLIATVPCFAAPILSGSVSYDSVTKLYTYAYTMDNTNGPATITELSVLIDSTTADFTLTPTSFTSPSGGWNFVTAVSGSVRSRHSMNLAHSGSGIVACSQWVTR